MSDSKGLNIEVEDPKAQLLMLRFLGLMEMTNMLATELGHCKVQLHQRLKELYPSLNIDEDWIYDLRNLRLRKIVLESGEKNVSDVGRPD